MQPRSPECCQIRGVETKGKKKVLMRFITNSWPSKYRSPTTSILIVTNIIAILFLDHSQYKTILSKLALQIFV